MLSNIFGSRNRSLAHQLGAKNLQSLVFHGSAVRRRPSPQAVDQLIVEVANGQVVHTVKLRRTSALPQFDIAPG